MPTAPRTDWEKTVEEAMQDCVDVFGEPVTYTHLGGNPYTTTGIFEAATEQVDPDTGVAILSNQPMISFKLSALQAIPRQNDRVTIRGKAYQVVEPEFDGQGTVTLRLHER